MRKVMITVRDGVIQSVTSTKPIKFLVVNHDVTGRNLNQINFDEKFEREDFLRTEEEMRLYVDGANNE